LDLQVLIDSAENGATLALPTGQFEQDLRINKSLNIIGQDVTLRGKIHIVANSVSISNFRFLNGQDNEEPVIKIEANEAKILNNMFDTTQDAVEVLIDSPSAVVKSNVIYSDSHFNRSWSMILATGQADNAKIEDNSFIGSSHTGIFSPITLTTLTAGEKIDILNNRFSNTATNSINVLGEGAVLNITGNTQDLKNILINDEPQSLNGFADLEAGAEDIEQTNPGATVVLDF